MGIDDPYQFLQTLNDSDERQQSPILHGFSRILELFSAVTGQPVVNGISVAFQWLAHKPVENISELLRVLADELNRRGAQIEAEARKNEEHRSFMADSMPGLVLDAMRRAESLRAKDRIGRLARILVHSAEIGRVNLADYAEEMMRISTELDERDVYVLRDIVRPQGAMVQEQTKRVKPFAASQTMPAILGHLRESGFAQGEVDSICGKLESYGLLSRTERHVNAIADSPTPFALLQKGLDFVEYIRSHLDISEQPD